MPARFPDLVLFACVENAGRSQMAAALFNRRAGQDRAHGVSAGTRPGTRVHPVVVEVMKEVGVDLAAVTPRFLAPELEMAIDYLVTLGCDDACPHIAGIGRVDWPLEDPKGQSLEVVRGIRDEIDRRVQALIAARGWG